MLVIRSEQVTVFTAPALLRFKAKLKAHLEQAFAQQCDELGTDKLKQLIDNGINSAKQYNFISEADVFHFFNLIMLGGEEFDTTPEAVNVLDDVSLSNKQKFDELYSLIN